MKRSGSFRILSLGLLLAALLAFASRSGALQALAEIILSGHRLPAQGAPVAATHAKLSEHEIEALERLPPQQQAERLMQAAINHDEGATRMILAKVGSWRGHLKKTKAWDALVEQTALYSNDLRVRAAAIEAELAAYGLEKAPHWADGLMEGGRAHPENRPFDAWVLGMLANRGVETARIHDLLREWAHDPDESTRFWAVEGMALIGTGDTIPDLLDALRNDPSHRVRERGGCGLAKSGMLTREQRVTAVPGLIDIAADPATDPVTRNWTYQALREITNEPLPRNPAVWRDWFAEHGNERAEPLQGDDPKSF
jgi:HEAT repeat protein